MSSFPPKSRASRTSSSSPSAEGDLAAEFNIVEFGQRPHQLEKLATYFAEEWPEAGDFAQFRSSLGAHLKPSNGDKLPKTWLAEREGELAGAISLVRYHSENKASVWLANLLVVPGYRRLGLGQVLLETAEAGARQLNIDLLRLATRDRQDYYRARGWCWLSDKQINGRSVTVFGKSWNA